MHCNLRTPRILSANKTAKREKILQYLSASATALPVLGECSTDVSLGAVAIAAHLVNRVLLRYAVCVDEAVDLSGD